MNLILTSYNSAMAKKPSLNVRLTPKQSDFVRRQVREGKYRSQSDVLREGLRRLEDDQRFFVSSVRELREKIAEGLADVEAGRVVDGPAFFAKMREMKRRRRKKVA